MVRHSGMRKLFLACVAITIILQSNLIPVQGHLAVTSDLSKGPYVDEIVYHVINNQDQRILALQAGEIDMDTSFFDPVHYDTLNSDPDIDIFQCVRNGYGHITINCDKYPFNISAFRRAFAYAINKTRVTSELFTIGIISQASKRLHFHTP